MSDFTNHHLYDEVIIKVPSSLIGRVQEEARASHISTDELIESYIGLGLCSANNKDHQLAVETNLRINAKVLSQADFALGFSKLLVHEDQLPKIALVSFPPSVLIDNTYSSHFIETISSVARYDYKADYLLFFGNRIVQLISEFRHLEGREMRRTMTPYKMLASEMSSERTKIIADFVMKHMLDSHDQEISSIDLLPMSKDSA